MDKLFKSVEGKALDIDEKSNTVTVYYAAFGNKDSYDDIIVKGAFAKTIKERGPKAKDLIYHFKNHWEEVSKPSELIEEDYGLKAVVGFPNSTKGRDTIEEYKYGIWKYHSIGYSIIKQQQQDTFNELQELKLFEGSHVTFPANELAITQMIDLKGEGANILQLKSILEDFVRNSKATDETIQRFETQLAEIKSLITEPPAGTLPTKEDLLSVFSEFKN